ncbi:MAG: TonB-dependent receptor, partial [Rhodothermales bacterium]|nr:TonB-dependent receptor [Rhodothermales bacterium]
MVNSVAEMRYTLAFYLIATICATSAWAQSGKLAGQIVDQSGDPLIGATALIQGTTLGSAADADGRFVILNIPPGTYSVRFSFIGFQTTVIEGIRIQSNQTTEQSVTLSEQVFEGEEVVVTAERPLVDVSLTSSMSTISREEIDVLPVQQLDDLVNLQAGVVDGHFRGGRTGEVQYQVDGVSVNNPFDNSSTLQLDRSVLQEVQVISGTFDAEYGQAMSGVVNAVLRSGKMDEYEFSGEAFVGDYVSSADTRFPNVDDLDPRVLQNYQLTLSGPVPLLPRTTFIMNGQRLMDEGFIYGQRLFLPTDSVNFQTGFLEPTGDGSFVPMAFDRSWSWLGKISNTSLPNIKLEYQAVGNLIRRKRYNHGFRINPDGTKTQEQFSIVHGIDFTHTVTDRLYYTISLRQNYFDYEDLLYESVHDPRYLQAGQPENLGSIFDGANLNGVDLGRFIQRTDALLSKGSVTYQATPVHLFKAGYEVMVSDLDFGPPGILANVTRNGVEQLLPRTDTTNAIVNSYRPRQGAAFLQDRIEWRDLRVRAGLRVEMFDANTTVPSDLANPATSIEGAPESR